MLNYILYCDENRNVAYMMPTGKDMVLAKMPFDKALVMCKKGKMSISANQHFPIAVDDKYFFCGEIEEVKTETERTMESGDTVAEDKGKQKSKKKKRKQ